VGQTDYCVETASLVGSVKRSEQSTCRVSRCSDPLMVLGQRLQLVYAVHAPHVQPKRLCFWSTRGWGQESSH
jgi:hypothetical protein